MIQKDELIETFGEVINEPVGMDTLLPPSSLAVLTVVYNSEYCSGVYPKFRDMFVDRLPCIYVPKDTIGKALSMLQGEERAIDFTVGDDSNIQELSGWYSLTSMGKFRLFMNQRFIMEILSLVENTDIGVYRGTMELKSILKPSYTLIAALIKQYKVRMMPKDILSKVNDSKSVHTKAEGNRYPGMVQASVSSILNSMEQKGFISGSRDIGYKTSNNDTENKFLATIEFYRQLGVLLDCS